MTDLHRASAAKMFNVPYDQVTPLQRAKAKEANFYTTYGMSTRLDEFVTTTPYGGKRKISHAASAMIQGLQAEQQMILSEGRLTEAGFKRNVLGEWTKDAK